LFSGGHPIVHTGINHLPGRSGGPLIGKQKAIKPLRFLRLCGEQGHFVENPDAYLNAQLDIF
jgi:hypothetical protein